MKLGLLTLVDQRVQLGSGSCWRAGNIAAQNGRKMAVFWPEKVGGRRDFPHEGEDTCGNYVCRSKIHYA